MEPEKDIFEQWREKTEAKPWYIKLWDRIRGLWLHKIRYAPINIKYGIKNLIYWIPIIWYDRSWDQSSIYDILQHKLKKQAADNRKYSHHVGCERQSELMELCVRLIDKIREDWYEIEYADYVKTKYWFEPIEDRPGFSTWKSREISENLNEYFAKYPLIYKKVIKGEGKIDKHKIAMTMSRINHKRAEKLLFKIISEHIDGWWY